MKKKEIHVSLKADHSKEKTDFTEALIKKQRVQTIVTQKTRKQMGFTEIKQKLNFDKTTQILNNQVLIKVNQFI